MWPGLSLLGGVARSLHFQQPWEGSLERRSCGVSVPCHCQPLFPRFKVKGHPQLAQGSRESSCSEGGDLHPHQWLGTSSLCCSCLSCRLPCTASMMFRVRLAGECWLQPESFSLLLPSGMGESQSDFQGSSLFTCRTRALHPSQLSDIY